MNSPSFNFLNADALNLATCILINSLYNCYLRIGNRLTIETIQTKKIFLSSHAETQNRLNA